MHLACIGECAPLSNLLNPYASPELPSTPDPAYEHRTIHASFVMDEATQRDAARGYQMRHVFWLGSSLIPMLILMALPYFLWNGDIQVLVMAGVMGFIVGSCATIGMHVALDWSIFWHNLRMLRRHPVLGALGNWHVQIDEEMISIATDLGQQSWSLDRVRRMELNRRPIVLWLERDLAIALAKHGDYGEDDYSAMRTTVRRRIAHIGGPLAQGRLR